MSLMTFSMRSGEQIAHAVSIQDIDRCAGNNETDCYQRHDDTGQKKFVYLEFVDTQGLCS